MIDGETRTRILSNLRAIPDSRRKSGAPCSVALARSLGRLCAADAEWRGSHPFNAFAGTDATARGFWFPLMRAFPDLERRDDLFFGGRWKGSDFVAACGHFVGTFAREFAGIPPSGGAAFLRYGEFHKISGGGGGEGRAKKLNRRRSSWTLSTWRGSRGCFRCRNRWGRR